MPQLRPNLSESAVLSPLAAALPWTRVLLLAAVYFITAKLGLLLAIAPGYATSVWPPSGIALGALLLWPRLWPAIWLGSFCTNLSIAFDPATAGSMTRSAALAALIGAGAVLQAQAGKALVRRCVGATLQLRNEREVFRCLLLAGPLACVINASWSVPVLMLSGEIPAPSAAFTWATWWVGDTIGVLIFAPLTYMWLSREEEWRARRWGVTIPLAIVLLVAFCVFAYTMRSEARQGRQHFERDAALVTAALQRRVDRGLEIVHALASFFAASEHVEQNEFERFTATLLSRQRELQQVFWAPRVATAGGDTFPLRYIATRADALSGTQLDLARDTELRHALERAASTGASVSAPTEHRGHGMAGAYVLLVPLYDPALAPSASAAQRQATLRGFTGGLFDIEHLAAAALQDDPSAPQLRWRLEDRVDGRIEVLHRTAATQPGNAATQRAGADVRHTIRVADREWLFVFEPTFEYSTAHAHLIAWLVLGAGLLFTVLVGAGALIVTGRTMTIKAEVQARTEELAQINGRLAEEVCEHIRTEETLEREREFLKAVLDNLSEGIIVVSSANSVTMANRAAHTILVRVLGMADALDEGWNAQMEFFAADGQTPLLRKDLPRARALRGETTRDFEVVMRYPGRAPVRLLVTGQPLLGADRLQRGAVVVLRDITDTRKIEQLKREFVATVSHELRTPLTSIRGSLGLLTSGKMGAVPNKVQHLIEMAARNTERLTFLINDLLDVEKIEQGAMKFELSEQSLDVLVQQAVETQQGTAQSCNVSIRVHSDHRSPPVWVDPQRLQQVLANLLSNAIKFSPPQSEVLVRLAHDTQRCHVSVKDHGPGIAPEFRHRIFQKFSQADSSDTRLKGGTGLGLAISKALIERMGGTIGYDSERGCGATFYFELPVRRERI